MDISPRGEPRRGSMKPRLLPGVQRGCIHIILPEPTSTAASKGAAGTLRRAQGGSEGRVRSASMRVR
jgi:hypothetical protein